MILEIALIIALALSFGSFVTMASFRLSLESSQSSFFKRSYCPSCLNSLKIKNLIPLISFLLQKGRCSFCNKKISSRYFAIELGTLLVFLAVYFFYPKNIDIRFLVLLLIITLLLIAVVTDIENYFISDSIQIFLAIFALIYHLVDSHNRVAIFYYLFSSLLYFLFSFLLYYLYLVFLKKNALGVDDIKFFAVAGFLLGIDIFHLFILISGVCGVLFGILWKYLKKNDNTFPFAPSLVASLIICLISTL